MAPQPIVKTGSDSVYSNTGYLGLVTNHRLCGHLRPVRRTIGVALFFLYLSLALVLVWTYRLARAKARQPWLWTAAALAITVIGHESCSETHGSCLVWRLWSSYCS